MSVAELIEELKRLPQHMPVKVVPERKHEGSAQDVYTVSQRGGFVLLRGVEQ